MYSFEGLFKKPMLAVVIPRTPLGEINQLVHQYKRLKTSEIKSHNACE
jgi:hypothetical protein